MSSRAALLGGGVIDLNAVVSRSTSLFKVLCLRFPFGSGYNVVCPRSIRPYHINRITRPLASPSKCYLHDSRRMIDEILGGDSWIIRCSRLDITSFLISSIRICISRTICRACFISTSSEAVPTPSTARCGNQVLSAPVGSRKSSSAAGTRLFVSRLIAASVQAM